MAAMEAAKNEGSSCLWADTEDDAASQSTAYDGLMDGDGSFHSDDEMCFGNGTSFQMQSTFKASSYPTMPPGVWFCRVPARAAVALEEKQTAEAARRKQQAAALDRAMLIAMQQLGVVRSKAVPSEEAIPMRTAVDGRVWELCD
jgi:hypothetical protein